MKRTAAYFLCLLLLLSLMAGCKSDEEKDAVSGGKETDRSSVSVSSGQEDVGKPSAVTVNQRNNGTYDGPPGTWAIYWYLCGTDLESTAGFATSDLLEMLEVTLPDNVTVVIETGGAFEWQNNIMGADSLERYTYTGNELTFIESRPSASMGAPETLADFLDYCNKNYPAEKQALILWDHGGGSLYGLELDELYSDILTLPEFKAAIETVRAVSGMYEFVGMDACLMATVDMVGILMDDASYMIASEETEPGIGWNYTGLFSALAADTTMSGAELGAAICDSFYAACAEFGLEKEVTLSVVSIEKAGALLDAYNAAGDEALLMAVSDKESYLSAFGRAAYDSEYYGGGDYEMVDLGDLVKNAEHLLPQNGKTLLDALSSCVVYHVKGAYRSRASGLACYYLYSGKPASYELFKKLDTSLPFRFFYEYIIQGKLSQEAINYIEQLSSQPSPGPLVSTEEMGFDRHSVYVGSDGHWHMDLGPELVSNLAAVFVDLYWVEPVSGLQVMWGESHDLTADWERGVFIEDFRDEWGCIDDAQVFMTPVDYSNGRVLYAAPILLNGEYATLSIGYSKGAYEILGVTMDSDTRLASKSLRLLKPGDVVEPIHFLVPVHDDGSVSMEDMPMGMIEVDDNTSFYTRSLGNGYFKLRFQMIDYAGVNYFSDFCSFRVRNNELTRLPQGIVTNAMRPDYSVEVKYIREESWRHDAWHEDIEYCTAIVDPETYRNLAYIVDTYPEYDSMTGTYTIQIVSQTISLNDYIGVQMAYLVGSIRAADSAFDQRDIVFEVENIVVVW